MVPENLFHHFQPGGFPMDDKVFLLILVRVAYFMLMLKLARAVDGHIDKLPFEPSTISWLHTAWWPLSVILFYLGTIVIRSLQ